MKDHTFPLIVLALMFLTGCEVVGGIFATGLGVGVFLVVVFIIVAAIYAIRSRKH